MADKDKNIKTNTQPASDIASKEELEAVMKKYDRESNTRVWEGTPRIIVYAIMAAFSVFVIYVTLFATWLDLIRYPSFVGCIIIIGYLMYPAKKGVQKTNHIPWYDWIIMILGAGAYFYIVANAQDLTVRLGMMNVKPYEIVIGIIGILATFELCRRAVGIPILCV
ncbi:MAG: TRAP transporter permease, partial [Lachnospiraceae bacterium]|nr:TRAP transporter permease [Lachnospiraceae bacterium]